MSINKHCSRCDTTKPFSEFHANKRSADGLSSRCKPCAIAATKAYRKANKQHYVAYDKARSQRPDRVAARKAYAKTEKGKLSKSLSMRKYVANHPDRHKATTIFSHQLRIGAIKPLPCQFCGSEKTEGHHPDYSRPLDVVWLCIPHHKQVHRMTRDEDMAAYIERMK